MGGEWDPTLDSCDPNPCVAAEDFADHNVGACLLTVTDQGIIGFMSEAQEEGSGFVYPHTRDDVNHLWIGSLWVCEDSSYVANRDYDADPAGGDWVVSQDPDGHIWYEYEDSDLDIHSMYTDGGAGESLDVLVHQESWAFENPGIANAFVIMKYTLKNRSDESRDLYAGVFLDFDIETTPSDDEGAVITENNLVYMRDQATGLHVGLAALESADPVPLANLTLVHNPTHIYGWSYMPDGHKYLYMSAGDADHIITESAAPDDHSVLASFGPFPLGPGEEREVAFAIIGGDDLEHTQLSAIVAQTVYAHGIADAGDEETGLVVSTRLLPSRPNPFRDRTAVRFELAQPGNVTVGLYDVSGRQVKVLTDRLWAAGRHSLMWDGKDDGGRRLSGGVYYMQMVTSDKRQSRPVILLR
jgi:hypothetical protein